MARWKDGPIKEVLRAKLTAAMSEILLDVEGEAKKELYKGHGVLTGTLRRDLHAEGPEVDGNVIRGRVGAWVDYALAVHQGHDGFEGYHYLTNGLDRTKQHIDEILKRHQVQG